jgi:integrase
VFEGVDDKFKRFFYFYEETGVRAIEPFIGELLGDWLIVDSDKSKGKNVRDIHLTGELKTILKEMQSFRDSYIEMGSKRPNEAAYERISKMLAKAVKGLNFQGKKLTIKSFRHTYGIKRVTITGDIFQVAREMGHKNVTTTQHYLRFPEQRRLDDFPSLREYIQKGIKSAIRVADFIPFWMYSLRLGKSSNLRCSGNRR